MGKDIVIPVEVCFEKFLADIEYFHASLESQINRKELRNLTQQEMDAILITKYQCNTLGKTLREQINEQEGRDVLFDAFKERHGKNGNFEKRTNVEMNIYFEGNYKVEGGIGDTIRVEPWEELDAK